MDIVPFHEMARTTQEAVDEAARLVFANDKVKPLVNKENAEAISEIIATSVASGIFATLKMIDRQMGKS